MDKCHYCSDVIERMDSEYDALYKELKSQERVYKRLCHREVLCQVIYHRSAIYEMLTNFIKWEDVEWEIDDNRDTPRALLTKILELKEFSKEIAEGSGWREHVPLQPLTDEEEKDWVRIIETAKTN